MATTTPRGIRIPQLGDIPDVPADMNRLATDLDSRLIWSQGLLANRPAAPAFSGTVYWATDDTTAGPAGTLHYWDGGAWSMTPGNTPTAGQKAALAGTTGTPNGTTNKYVTATDPKLSILASSAVQVRDVGEANNLRAGRVLTAADFTNMGLSAPLGLWNLGDLTDVSGNARALTNKGAVPFGPGIRGAATEAAIFSGSTAQALYIATGTAAEIALRITTGTWGCWFKTAKRGTSQVLMHHGVSALGNRGWNILASAPTNLSVAASYDGTTSDSLVVTSVDVYDDRWHFAVATHDGSKMRLFVDGNLEGTVNVTGTMFAAAGPYNIGAQFADAATAGNGPLFGRADEAFVTADILSEDQVRNLYCVGVSHALAAVPANVKLNVRRRRRGGTVATTDFPSTPLRLYQLDSSPNPADQGSNNVALASGGTGSIFLVPGASGTAPGGLRLVGATFTGTDAGLPSALASRSYGIWFKTINVTSVGVISWGTLGTADARLITTSNGGIQSLSAADAITGPFVADGFWHHFVTVEDNAPFDGVKRKLYFDGRLVASSTVLNSLTLAGANRFRIGGNPDGTAAATGEFSRAFVIGVALTSEQVKNLYNLGAQTLAASPKAEGDHIEAMEATRLLATLDTLEGCDQVDLLVSA